MATEDFKMLTEELFDNYISLREDMKEKGFENVNLSFREYLDFYIEYEKEGLSYEDEEPEEDEDYEDDSSEDDSK